jgi:hypothetical protein
MNVPRIAAAALCVLTMTGIVAIGAETTQRGDSSVAVADASGDQPVTIPPVSPTDVTWGG